MATDGFYVVIPTACPECKGEIKCDVAATLGFALYEPNHSVECPRCGKRVMVDLPGEPLRVYS